MCCTVRFSGQTVPCGKLLSVFEIGDNVMAELTRCHRSEDYRMCLLNLLNIDISIALWMARKGFQRVLDKPVMCL